MLHSSEHWLMMERLDKEEAQDLLKRILLDRFDRNDYMILQQRTDLPDPWSPTILSTVLQMDAETWITNRAY